MTTTMSLLAVFSIMSISVFDVNAQEEGGYKMAEEVTANVKFTFRDGIESYQFPVFKMTSNLVDNSGTTFQLQGIIEKSPHLHKALDDAFKYRLMTSTGGSSFEYDYRFFDVDVDILREDKSVFVLHYYNCEILSYKAESLNSKDYESYHSSKSGFAVVDTIDFRCGGVNSSSSMKTSNIDVIGKTSYAHSQEVRTIITFEFDGGIEKIEFPSFELTSGFSEEDDAVVPGFSVQGVVNEYPLLYKAIDYSRKVSGIGTAYNADFEALVEFSNNEKVLRAIDFRDCRVSGAIVNTEFDKEEGYTGKSGFAIVNEIDFQCAGMTPINNNYAALYGDTPIWRTTELKNQQMNEDLNTTGPRVIATFTYGNGVETIEFPVFVQGNVLSKSNPTFELKGIVGDYPMLYKSVDQNLKTQSVSGSNPTLVLFDVDVNLMNGNEIIRGFNYHDCRVIDYVVASAMNSEENYIKGQFALENIFEFACHGYHANNPAYDALFKSEKGATISSKDLRNTDDWGPRFSKQ